MLKNEPSTGNTKEQRAITFRDETLPLAEADLDLINRLLEIVRTCYMDCMREKLNDWDYGRDPIPRWDGGESRTGQRITPVWIAVTRAILQIGAQPQHYMESHFARAGRPQPLDLCTPEALATWDRGQALGRVSRELSADHSALRGEIGPIIDVAHWEEDRAIRYCLNSTAVINLTPLFRYCVASIKDFPETKARFRERALIQYVFQQAAYDASWGSFVPSELQESANELRAYFIS